MSFIFNDDLQEVLKSCESHRQRSILLLAIFEFCNTGIEPEIPKGLTDKWRYVHALLQGNFSHCGNSFETVVKTISNQIETEPKRFENKSKSFSDDYSTIVNYNNDSDSIDSDRNDNDRIDGDNDDIDSEEDSNDEEYNDSDDDWFPSIECTTAQQDITEEEIQEAWKDMSQSAPQHGIEVSLNTKPFNIDDYKDMGNRCNASEEEIREAWKEISATTVNTSVAVQESSQVKSTYSTQELEKAGGLVYQRIWDKYQRIGKPVSYTRNNAEQDLQMATALFYDAIAYLSSIGSITCKKVKMADGRIINSITPLAAPQHCK